MIAPSIMVTIIGATISATRTGTGLAESLQRGTQLQTLMVDFKNTITSASTISVYQDTQVSADVPLARLPARASMPSGEFPDTTRCIRSTWNIVADGDRSELRRRVAHFASEDCAGSPLTEVSTSFTGLSQYTRFVYANKVGRQLVPVGYGTTLTPGNVARPANISDTQWGSAALSSVTLAGEMRLTFGSRPLEVTGYRG